MSTITKQQAERLATDYNAFNTAYKEDDNLGIVVWGRLLLETQAELGIEMYTESLVKSMVRSAERDA